MAAVPPPDLDRTIPVPLRRPDADGGARDLVAGPELLRLYLMLGGLGMLVGGLFIALEHPRQPLALPLAWVYGVIGLAGFGLRWAPKAWQRRWSVRALQWLVGLAIVTAAIGSQLRGYGLAAPSVIVVPVLVFSIAALLGWRRGLVQALLALAGFVSAQATAQLVALPVPWGSLAAGLLVALTVAVAAGGALHARIFQAVSFAARREQRFRRLLALAADVYWEVDEQLRLVAAGRQEQEPRSLSATALAGVRFDALPGLVLEPEVRAQLDLAAAERRPFRDLPAAWRHADGVLRSYRLSGEPRLDSAGRLRGYWGVARDVTAMETTRAALADSRSRFETLFVHAPLPLLLHVDSRIVDANPAAARLLGHESVQSLRGLPLLTLYARDADRELAVQRLRQLADSPPGTRLPMVEISMRVADRAVIVSATAVRVELKGGPAVLSMFVDVTERHQAEQALRRSEATLAHLVATSPDLITLTDQETGRYEMVNPAFERFSGFSHAEAVGRTSLELGIWADPAARERFVHLIRRDGVVADLPILFQRRSGEKASLMISAASFQLEGRPMLVINGRDVTAGERERLERSAILDNAGIGIAVTRDRRFVLANAEFERMIGWPGGSLIGQSGVVVWKSEVDYAEVGREIGPALARGEKVEIEREVRRRDGSCFLARLRAAVVDAQQPTGGGTVWIVEDITERRHFEQALARARDDAEAANRAKSAFLANTSHELRTPLNGLLGLARLARDPDLAEPLRHQYLSLIEDSAQSLAAIISDILDLSKIEAGRLPIDQAPFDVVELLQSLARTYRTLAEARGLQLLLDIDEGLGGSVSGDALRVRQIVSNYLTNAIKFTERGFVRLSARRGPDAAGAAGPVMIECEDTGPGIRPEVAADLFKPFTQADQSTTRRFGGTGLGLSICRELATLMDGRVGVSSLPGLGSRFWAELPLPPVAPAAGTGAARPDAAGLQGLRVLMVEDNPVNMLIGVATLERWGARVTQAHDGPEALAAIDAAAEPFDAVLMDVQMPGMSGHETTRALRQRRGGQGVPVIALTAAALVSEREQAMASGMDDFLTKPIDADRLLATLLRWRQGRQPNRPGQPPASEATGTGRPVR
jgi:PAS domain S-box-containing protein